MTENIERDKCPKCGCRVTRSSYYTDDPECSVIFDGYGFPTKNHMCLSCTYEWNEWNEWTEFTPDATPEAQQ